MIESWWGQDFLHLSGMALGPTQARTQWIPGFSQGLSGWDVALTAQTLLALRLKKK